MIKKDKDELSELRLDLVSDDWVVISKARRMRPEMFSKKISKRAVATRSQCPFCDPKILDRAIFKKGDIISIPNDFPIFSYKDDLNERSLGPYHIMDGVGFHEVIITLDHNKHIALSKKEEIKDIIDVYQARYLALKEYKFIKYISIFHNHGRAAGASIIHPHSQLVASPVIDPDLKDSIDGAENYHKKHGACVYCTMLDWDRKEGKRIIYENESFIVLCPFAPQSDFEVRIYPKLHNPDFENITDEEKMSFADAISVALGKIYKGLNDPDYNFYIHTAPINVLGHKNYHWHLVILPKTSIFAGFEMSSSIEVNTISPEEAAEFLRKIK